MDGPAPVFISLFSHFLRFGLVFEAFNQSSLSVWLHLSGAAAEWNRRGYWKLGGWETGVFVWVEAQKRETA